MSKWHNSFSDRQISGDNCHCSNNKGLFIPNRQLSFIVAGLLFIFFGFFIVGYFLGKQSSIEQFTDEINRNAVSDQAYVAKIASNDNKHDCVIVSEPENVIDGTVEVVIATDPVVTDIQNETTQQFYAQLIGFGTEKAAQKFVQKLQLKDIETFVKKRISKTAKGKTIYWYQVVTSPYDNKEQLITLVSRLTKEERLSGVRIEIC